LHSIAVIDDFVMSFRPTPSGRGESIPDLNTLDGLNAHKCPSEARIKSSIPVNIGAKTRRKSPNNDLDNTTQCVTVLVCLVDLSHHRSRRLRVRATQGVFVKTRNVLGARNWGVLRNADRTDGNRV
jgi:hypothetical protein